jgi:DNA end-binding protein Ku
MVCPADGKEIHPEHIVRGFEVEKDRYVIVRDEELESCAPEKTRAIEITDFVELSGIDPLYFDRPYYVLPQAGASKSYRLLVEAMTRTNRVGLARLIMHEKEHLVALRPMKGLLCAQTMNFHAEVVPLSDIEDLGGEMKLTEKEAKAAGEVVRELSGKFDAKHYRDEYRECVRKMLEKLAHGDRVVKAAEAEADDEPEEKPARNAKNLMAALEASLAEARGRSSRKRSRE